MILCSFCFDNLYYVLLLRARIANPRYRNWSADNGSIGMEPTKDRKRKTF